MIFGAELTTSQPIADKRADQADDQIADEPQTRRPPSLYLRAIQRQHRPDNDQQALIGKVHDGPALN
jgi:hypothetical protein